MLPILRLNHSNLTHPQRLNILCPPPRTYPSNLRRAHMYRLTRLANECHRCQHRSVLAVLEVCPYPLLVLWGVVELDWGGLVDGSSGYGGEETGAEEDGEDGEVLDGVGD